MAPAKNMLIAINRPLIYLKHIHAMPNRRRICRPSVRLIYEGVRSEMKSNAFLKENMTIIKRMKKAGFSIQTTLESNSLKKNTNAEPLLAWI